ncbi:restriction of telomere capping protein 5 [Mytilinidion resinicola]|uniref:Restriction of telomere capping protein 5 n=1 Tax=Mytilinidion resinicola TaxID=574789 RepID=A0A6A6Z3J6_9PEZI|nr:restriction of telomere capping protein 5 [Mytilinidion resinicola]KAF2814854.1 restriction of telomere capping protein 5 [Mytilinidion resinicola]
MGQGSSADSHPLSLEQLSHDLAHRFAQKCYTPLELYCFNSVFRSLADSESGIRYWSEATLCRFLELPDALGVGSVVFHMASYLGAFPFPSQAPAILTAEAMLKVVTILTERYGSVIKRRGREMWLRELYRSLAVYDRGLGSRSGDAEKESSLEKSGNEAGVPNIGGGSSQGFAVDQPIDDDEDEDEEDELILAALDSMDATEVFKHGETSNVHHSIIPTDNFLKMVELLLLIAPIDPQQSLSTLAPEISDKRISGLRNTANMILSSFGVEQHPGVTFKTFTAVISSSLPYLFDGLNPLFEHFLFAKDFDLSKRKSSTVPKVPEVAPVIPDNLPLPEPILREAGEILDLNVLSQLSFFIKGTNLFRRLRPLYSGNKAGFSMGSFEKAVFNWRAPSLLLVSGTLLPASPTNARERTLSDSLPPARLHNSIALTPSLNAESTTLTFGAYIPGHWRQSHKTCFGDPGTTLFQLAPTHDVFPASHFSTDYIYFNKPPTRPSGLGFGSALPHQTQSLHGQGGALHIPLGPVSLHLDDALEFGIFTHLASGGGSFHTSQLPCRKNKDWQDRFEIESLEVWGCGGDEEAEAQRKEYAWQEREAENRRRVNLGTGDIDADRELLKMAGLIGGGMSGGSV